MFLRVRPQLTQIMALIRGYNTLGWSELITIPRERQGDF
jgi:hypothetical protein